ncbi:mobile mystery protein A [Inquilinus sp. CAU 1745]|uniref:mobile mystery protein A n=1 Tax=Inquilinus sp. CAU 1745 TaxID=3140369 RepID=UPI00325B534C
MSVKQTALHQYQAMVNRVALRSASLRMPPEGWLRTVRKALGMSGAQLARRMGVTRARIAKIEQAELDGGVTLRSMQATAEAMGCRFVYAIVPPRAVEDVIQGQARKKAAAIVASASGHMALEDQALPEEKMEQEISRIAGDLLHEMPSDFWDDG